MKGINSGHFLMGVRADTWFRLLRENRFAVRPEQIRIESGEKEGCLPVTVYANQPAGSETLVSLQAGKSDFLAKVLGLVHYQINQRLYVHIPPEKINVYNAETTRLIKRARIGD